MDVKRYCQYPLTEETIEEIYRYVKGKIDTYEARVNVVKAKVDVDFDNGLIFYNFILEIKATGETITIPTWNVQVATS